MKPNAGLIIRAARREFGLTLHEVASKAGLSHTTISDYEKNRYKDPAKDTVVKIANALNLKLEQLWDDEQINTMPPKIVYLEKDTQQEKIILVAQKAQAGYIAHHKEEAYIEKMPMYCLPGFEKGTYRMFQIEGDSMAPEFQSDDIVICEYIERYPEITDNDIYIIVTESGIFFKRVINQIQQGNVLILSSNNPTYKPIALPKNKILEIWKYKKRLTA